MKGQFVIVEFSTSTIFRDVNNEIKFFDTEHDAAELAGFYEFENVWIVELKYNYVDK